MRSAMIWLGLAAAPLMISTAAQPMQSPSPAERCAALAGLSTAVYRGDAAEWVPGGPMPGRPGPTAAELPARCLFRVTLDPRGCGLPQLSYGTGIELRLPERWNQRLLVQGGGGLNGVLSPALGNVAGFPSALARGFAVLSNEGGHRGRSSIDTR